MNNSPLEFLARQYDNVVKYDAQGNPSIFVKFPKMKSKDLDSSLPDHTHPAFIVNGVEQDYILLGKYKAASLTGSGSDGGTLYSLPNMPPAYGQNADQFLSQLRAFGGGVSGMTVADRGFLLLLAQKNGWNPGGNSDLGHCYKDASRYEYGKAVTVGAKRGFNGWLYECLIAHTTSAELAPNVSPLYWKRIKQIGGTEAYPTMKEWQSGKLLEATDGFALLDDDDVDLEITHWSLTQLKDFCTLNGVNATGCETRDDYIDAIEKAFQDKEPPVKGGAE